MCVIWCALYRAINYLVFKIQHTPKSCSYGFISIILLNPLVPSMLTTDMCQAAVGTAVGVSVSVTFVVSFSMGVLVAYVLGYISRRSKESSCKPSSHANPATVHEVGTNKKMKGDAMEIDANTAYGSHVSSTVYDEVGNNKKRKGDAMEMNTNTAYGSHVL